MIHVNFKSWSCSLHWAQYDNKRPAILLLDAENGERIATATTNLPDYDMPENCVAIKDYSENAGMVEALRNAGVIKVHPIDYVSSGFVTIPVFELLPEAIVDNPFSSHNTQRNDDPELDAETPRHLQRDEPDEEDEEENPYKRQGYEDREDYFQCLAEDYNVTYETVRQVASLLGPNEDFDGLPAMLDDAPEGL